MDNGQAFIAAAVVGPILIIRLGKKVLTFL